MSCQKTGMDGVCMMGRFLPLLILVVVLAGCAGSSTIRSAESSTPAPTTPVVSEKSVALRAPASPYRVVVPGDTLYSIAWESGQDYRELAAWNRIPPPYVIKPGQQLRVTPPSIRDRKTADKPTTTAPGVKPAGKPKAVRDSRVAGTAAKAAPQVPARPAAGKSATAAAAPKPGASGKPPGKSAAVSRNKAASAGTGSADWSWPADGEVLNRYSESDSKGLDIAGPRGAPIRAAASGRVVYQGSGLRGYGQLIIIKHSEEFLSAYAHNDRIHVREGDAVKRGQKIADMGSTGADRIKLHFEIRRRGVPVDPLKYLPRR